MSEGGNRETILVAGASSQIGVFLLPRLVRSGCRVIAFSRRAVPSPTTLDGGTVWIHPGLVLKNGPPTELRADGLISAAPPALTAQLLVRNPGLSKVIQFTTSSILTKRESADAGERALMSRIATDEARLTALCEKHDIPLVVLRPTLIYGCGMDRNITRLWRWGNRFGFIPVARQSGGRRQPVHADDLAGLAVSALHTSTGRFLESAARGGSTLSYREMVEATAGCCRRKTRVLALPGPLFAAAIQAWSWAGGAGINREMVHRQAVDMVFDDTRLRQSLSWQPRVFRPAAEDFSISPHAAEMQFPA